MQTVKYVGVELGPLSRKNLITFPLHPPHINTTTFCPIFSLPSISTMSIFASAETTFQIDEEQSLQSVTISDQIAYQC